jgi:hypothetical protein
MGVQPEAWLVFNIFHTKIPNFENFREIFCNELSTWKFDGHLGGHSKSNLSIRKLYRTEV